MSPPRLQPPPPVIRPRDLLRLTSILFMGVFLLWAITKAQNPRTWDWLIATGEPEPQPEATAGNSTSRAPIPDAEVLNGAWDRQRFLVDDAKNLDEIGNWRDANARYHLIQLAAAAKADDLTADARKDVRYSALMQNPEKYRGQVIHIEGDLRRVSRFEMKRAVPSVECLYQGWLTADGREQTCCILFADLPAGFPPEKEWNRYVASVKFEGYFLKILKADDANQKDKPVFVPVLVGKTPTVPEQPPSNIVSIASVIVAVFAATMLICGVALWMYRRSDRRLAEKMAQLRRTRLDHSGTGDHESTNGELQTPIFTNYDEES